MLKELLPSTLFHQAFQDFKKKTQALCWWNEILPFADEISNVLRPPSARVACAGPSQQQQKISKLFQF